MNSMHTKREDFKEHFAALTFVDMTHAGLHNCFFFHDVESEKWTRSHQKVKRRRDNVDMDNNINDESLLHSKEGAALRPLRDLEIKMSPPPPSSSPRLGTANSLQFPRSKNKNQMVPALRISEREVKGVTAKLTNT